MSTRGAEWLEHWHDPTLWRVRSNIGKIIVRLRLALRQNKSAILFVAAWLTASAIVLSRALQLPALDAALVATCIVKMPGGRIGAYQSFTEVVVFGLVASIVVSNVTRRYRPEATCRELAAQARDHVVVIGYSNLGHRLVELTRAAGKDVVVVEKNAELVATLIAAEEPAVIECARERHVLRDAGVARARVVVIATDDLETAAVAARLVRELNADCELVIRAADEDVGAMLARTYRARAISTSRLAASFIQSQAVKLRAKRAVVYGKNNVGARVAEALAEKRIAVSHVEATSDPAALAASGLADADLAVLCDDDLGDNLLRVDRIRDANKRVRIVCRAFHEDAAQILTRSPFDCVIFSTSRQAADMLARSGVFREMGMGDAKVLEVAPFAS